MVALEKNIHNDKTLPRILLGCFTTSRHPIFIQYGNYKFIQKYVLHVGLKNTHDIHQINDRKTRRREVIPCTRSPMEQIKLFTVQLLISKGLGDLGRGKPEREEGRKGKALGQKRRTRPYDVTSAP